MSPLFPNFCKLSEFDLQQLLSIINTCEPYSDFNYVSLFCWNINDDTLVSILNNNLVVLSKDYMEDYLVISILGKNEINNSLGTIFNYLSKTDMNISSTLKLIPEVTVKNIAATNEYQCNEDIDNFDYILSSEEALALEGKKYANKRKKINRILRNEPTLKTALIDLNKESTKHEVYTLAKKWAQNFSKDALDAEMELKAIDKLLKNFAELQETSSLECISIYINDVLEAFCIYEYLGNEWAITHFGKADNTFNGLYELLMVEVLRRIYSKGSTKVNYEQDLGIEGLRLSKLDAKPIGYLKKYTINCLVLQ